MRAREVKVELAPGFVVATPSLLDPSFARSVVLLVEHGPSGSLGFVVNQPARYSFQQVSEALGIEAQRSEDMPIIVGGPVSPQSGWLIFNPEDIDDDELDDALIINDHLAVSASRRMLERIAHEGAPRQCMLALGYAGWGEGQLDAEFSQGAWIPLNLDANILFDVEPDRRWERVLAQSGIEPGRLVTMAGGGGELS